MASSGQLAAPALQELMADASLAGDCALDGAKSTIGLRISSIGGRLSRTTSCRPRTWPTPRSGITSIEEAMNSAPAIGESNE